MVNSMSNMTHDYVVLRAARWLLKSKNCLAVLVERGNIVTYENPDALGFKRGRSILLEAKANRNDFLADKRKPFRKDDKNGLGDYRYYICPKGLIKPEEIPLGWGLLHISGKKIYTIKTSMPFDKSFKANEAEMHMLTNAAVFRNGLLTETDFDDIKISVINGIESKTITTGTIDLPK